MFDDARLVVDWLFDCLFQLTDTIVVFGGWVGICVIGLPLLRRVINIFRKLL